MMCNPVLDLMLRGLGEKEDLTGVVDTRLGLPPVREPQKEVVTMEIRVLGRLVYQSKP